VLKAVGRTGTKLAKKILPTTQIEAKKEKTGLNDKFNMFLLAFRVIQGSNWASQINDAHNCRHRVHKVAGGNARVQFLFFFGGGCQVYPGG
jgi:hypothetical protein